jgi:ABC-type hemin transport system substrate-binding protein
LFGAAGAETLTLELWDIVALQPDVLLIGDDVSQDNEAVLKALDVPAAHNGRIVRVDITLLAWPGTRVARAFDALPALLDLGR